MFFAPIFCHSSHSSNALSPGQRTGISVGDKFTVVGGFSIEP